MLIVEKATILVTYPFVFFYHSHTGALLSIVKKENAEGWGEENKSSVCIPLIPRAK